VPYTVRMGLTTTSILIDLALLALFLISLTAAKYAFKDKFTRTRFIMTALFLYIVATLTVSFWHLAVDTLPFVIPAFIVGVVLGHLVGVRTEQQKIMMHGLERYMERFAHISKDDMRNFTWWSFVNFYSITCVLILINLVGITNVLLHGSRLLTIETSVVGAAFIGSIVPYLIHLWTLEYRHARGGR
jgi:hypothetical protein